MTIKAVETLCIVCLPPEGRISWKKYLGNRPSKKITFYKGLDIMKLTVKEDFHRGTVFFLVFLSQNHIFLKKYDFKLITLISMYHLKPLVSLDRFIKN